MTYTQDTFLFLKTRFYVEFYKYMDCKQNRKEYFRIKTNRLTINENDTSLYVLIWNNGI